MKTLYKWLVGLIVIGVIAGGVLLFNANFSLYRIQTGSMRPGLPIGAELIVHRTHTDFKKGDIITFRESNGQIVSHRFIGVDKKAGSLITKGDANLTRDVHFTPLRNQDVIGKTVLHTNLFAGAFWRSLSGVVVIVSLLILGWVLFSKNEEDATKTENEGEKESDEQNQLAGPTPV